MSFRTTWILCAGVYREAVRMREPYIEVDHLINIATQWAETAP